jgi:hypothetical protein
MLKLLHNKIERQIYALTAETGQLFILLLTIFDLSMILAATPSSAVLRNTLANNNNNK